jgi:hypothetical protein
MTAITIQHFGKMLVEAGVLTQERLNKTARIVIDADTYNGAVMIYVQEFGQGDALAKLAPMLKGML